MQESDKLSKVRRNWTHQRMATKVLRQMGKVHQNDPEMTIHGVGDEYTKAIFSPVAAVMMVLGEVFGTFDLPVYCIETTDLSCLDLSRPDAVIKIVVGTTQLGIWQDENQKIFRTVEARLTEVFHHKTEVKILPLRNTHVVDY